eukprot:CAMPEP_0170058962 /NCGR_PEP_ID=MMETSP0019_2-20121128/1400_1 /TAXON_ID=98059 /ORGANISM="Dinobryon sp., Strain UTEXLB2267" /LENGTH=200 /DNA_ID=CAMNT_0010264057 /DNA_START=30 /DNA_END=632 /DNA_ORIENTATION=+
MNLQSPTKSYYSTNLQCLSPLPLPSLQNVSFATYSTYDSDGCNYGSISAFSSFRQGTCFNVPPFAGSNPQNVSISYNYPYINVYTGKGCKTKATRTSLTTSCMTINLGGFGASESADGMTADASYAYQENDYNYFPYGSINPPKVAGLWSLGGNVQPTAAPTSSPSNSLSDGQIAGITIGALAGVAAVYGVIVFLSTTKP